MHIIYRCWLPTTIVKNSWRTQSHKFKMCQHRTHTHRQQVPTEIGWMDAMCMCVCVCRCMDLVEHGILSSKLFPNKCNTSMHMWLRPTLSSENFCKELFISISLSAGSCFLLSNAATSVRRIERHTCAQKFDMTHSMLPAPVLVNKTLSQTPRPIALHCAHVAFGDSQHMALPPRQREMHALLLIQPKSENWTGT